MLPREFYEQQRKLGLTEDITGDPEPDYSLPFYQNIFYMMGEYSNRENRCEDCGYKRQFDDAEEHINELYKQIGEMKQEISDLEHQSDIGRYGYGN